MVTNVVSGKPGQPDGRFRSGNPVQGPSNFTFIFFSTGEFNYFSESQPDAPTSTVTVVSAAAGIVDDSSSGGIPLLPVIIGEAEAD